MGRGTDGVTARETSIQIAFSFGGQPYRETMRTPDGAAMPPTPPNIKAARRLAKQIRAEILAGTFSLAEHFPHSRKAAKAATADVLTLRKACDEYLAARGRLARKTLNQYRNALSVWCRMFGDDTPLASLRHAKMAAAIGAHPWASAKLLNNYLIPLRGVWKLHGRDLGIADPTDGIENSPHQKPQPDPMSIDEREKVLARMAKQYDPRIHAYFAFAFSTGMRPEEQIALLWTDIDWASKVAKVDKAKDAGQIKPLKTYNARAVDLTDRAIEALKVMRAYTGSKGADVFENPVTGRPWHDERSQRDHYWTPTLAALGIRHRRAYCTRHTFATSSVMAGVNPVYVAAQMGHKNTKLLFDTYSRWIHQADNGRERAKLNEAAGKSIAQESHGGLRAAK